MINDLILYYFRQEKDKAKTLEEIQKIKKDITDVYSEVVGEEKERKIRTLELSGYFEMLEEREAEIKRDSEMKEFRVR